MPPPRPPNLLEYLIALKGAELYALAKTLRPSLHSVTVSPSQWVMRLAELAALDDLADGLKADYRKLSGLHRDGVMPRH